MEDQNPLPSEYKSSEGLHDSVSLLRIQVLERMLQDFEMAGAEPTTADMIVVERVSYVYAHIRSREMLTMARNHGFSSDRTYKEMLSLLFGATDQISKRLSTSALESEIRSQITEAAVSAVQAAVKEISDPELRARVLRNLQAELGVG